jgi:hypothetical protein
MVSEFSVPGVRPWFARVSWRVETRFLLSLDSGGSGRCSGRCSGRARGGRTRRWLRLSEGSVEVAQAMVPQALALARG